jgi:hypothetical protein
VIFFFLELTNQKQELPVAAMIENRSQQNEQAVSEEKIF